MFSRHLTTPQLALTWSLFFRPYPLSPQLLDVHYLGTGPPIPDGAGMISMVCAVDSTRWMAVSASATVTFFFFFTLNTKSVKVVDTVARLYTRSVRHSEASPNKTGSPSLSMEMAAVKPAEKEIITARGSYKEVSFLPTKAS